MKELMKFLKDLWDSIRGKGDVKPVPVPVPIPNDDPVTPDKPGALLPKPSTLCEPNKGIECPVPFGKDIRGWAWSPSKRDVIPIGCDAWKRSLSQNGKTITAKAEWTDKGIRYVCYGHREPTSNSALKENLSGEYQTTMRWYYWATNEAPVKADEPDREFASGLVCVACAVVMAAFNTGCMFLSYLRDGQTGQGM